jgi:DNA-binding phage protein
MKIRYQLSNIARAKRLAELADFDNPNALESEIAVARMLQEEAINQNDIGTAVALLNTIAKLSQTSEVAKFRRGELLTRATVLGIAQQMVNVLSSNIAEKFPGWEDTLEVVQNNLLTVVSEARNEEPGEDDESD